MGETLILFATGVGRFDIIVSKYGCGENLENNHHFYHWSSRSVVFTGGIGLDDYDTNETDTDVYVV
jgi:hypothetical protein